MACFSLEEFQTAKATFEEGLKLDPNNSQYKTWIRKCDVELAGDASFRGLDCSFPAFLIAADALRKVLQDQIFSLRA